MTMSGAWALARVDIGRHWRSLVVVALLVALGAALAMTAVAGARRGASAADRLLAQTKPATVFVTPNDPSINDTGWWNRLRSLPYVEAVGPTVIFTNLGIKGIDPVAQKGLVSYPAYDGNLGRTLEKPVVLDGRMYHPDAVDEITVTRQFADTFGLHVGQRLEARLPAGAQAQSNTTSYDELGGPTLTLRIVGIIRSQFWIDNPEHPGSFAITPALVHMYSKNVVGPPGTVFVDNPINAQVRLAHGTRDVPRLHKDVDRLLHKKNVNFVTFSDRDRLGRTSAGFESDVLYLFALAEVGAAALLVGQGVGRHIITARDDLNSARAIGATPRELTLAGAAGPAIAGLTGAALGAVAAVVASRWFPIGAAANTEPEPGIRVDWLVLAGGIAASVLYVAAVAWLVARFALRPVPNEDRRRSSVATATSRLPLPFALGGRLALEAGHGSRHVPVLPALSGALIGVIGVVTAVAVSHGINDGLTHYARFGQTYDAGTTTGVYGQDYLPPAEARSLLESLPSVTHVDEARFASVPGINVAELNGAEPTILSGRLPESVDETALAPETLTQQRVKVGGRITLAGDKSKRTLRVVGVAYTYNNGATNHYAGGAWVTSAGYDQLFGGFEFRNWYLHTRPSGDAGAAAVLHDMKKLHPDLIQAGMEIDRPDLDLERGRLLDLRGLPSFLGGFLAVLGLGALAHALILAIRRRSHELGVGRTLGMTPGQAATVVLTHATVTALVGIAFGVPLGLAAARWTWLPVAHSIPMQFVAPRPWAMVGLVGLASVLAALLVATIPAMRTARRSVAEILRVE